MKKILIPIAIVIVLAASIVVGYCYKTDAPQKTTTTKVSTTTENSVPNQNIKKNINNNSTTNTTTSKDNQQNKAQSPATTNSTANGITENTNKSNNNNSNSDSTNINTSPSTNTSNTNSSTDKNNVGTNSIIKVITPSTNLNSQILPSTILVENTTGNPISNSMLNNVIRNWILNWQFNYNTYCVATGENWAPQWLNAIPDSALINAFVQANGEAALSKNITAGEINKGAALYTEESYKMPMPFPFSQAQATVYIQQMLNQDYKGTEISKIVFHPDSNGNSAGLYYVYTKKMLAEGYKQPFWYVYSNTGQATGV
ncbi:MAG: hypothetical protein ACRDD2_13200 [Sarcina sp.]